MRTLACILSLALIGSVLSTANLPATSTATTGNSVTGASFNSTPDKVLDVTNTSVLATVYDGEWFASTYQSAVFGPGSTNTTLYLWGFGTSGTAGSNQVVNLIVRTISATIAAYGNDTLEAAVPSGTADSSSSQTVTATNQLRTTALMYGVGPATVAVAAVQTIGFGTVATEYDAILLYIGTTSGLGAPKTIATTATPLIGGGSTTSYSYFVNQVWYEDGVWYLLYETQTFVGGASTYAASGLYIQGWSTVTSALWQTAATTVISSSFETSSTAANFGLVGITGARAQNSNYTNSTSIYVIWNDLTAAGGFTVVKGAIVTRSSGAVSTAAYAIAQASASGTVYSAGGIITGNGSSTSYGWIVGSYVTSTTTAAVMAYLNTNTTAVSLGLTLTSDSATSGAIMATGMYYGTGFFVVASYATSSGKNYIAQTYLSNTTVNTTQVTLGSFATNTAVNIFADANGALWFGYVILDNAASPTKINSAYVGKLYGQINATTTTTTFGNVLATFAALLSFVMMSLFMF